MTQRRGALVLTVLVLFASSNALLGQSKDEKKKDEAQKKEIANEASVREQRRITINPFS